MVHHHSPTCRLTANFGSVVATFAGAARSRGRHPHMHHRFAQGAIAIAPGAAVCGESVGAPVSPTPSWSGASLSMDLRRDIGPSTCPAVPYFMDQVVASQLRRARFAWSSSVPSPLRSPPNPPSACRGGVGVTGVYGGSVCPRADSRLQYCTLYS